MLVIDASVAIAASHTPIGLARFRRHRLVAPRLMRAEAASVLHEMVWRKEVDPLRGRVLFRRVLDSPVVLEDSRALTEQAWNVADRFGWAKVYDAHYVALAQMLGCPLVTVDERLLRGTARLGIARRPDEI